MMVTEELKTLLEKDGYFNIREIEGRGVCAIQKFMFTFGLVYSIDLNGYKGRWCYGDHREALVAINEWDDKNDPPYNWIKYKGDGGERVNTLNLQES